MNVTEPGSEPIRASIKPWHDEFHVEATHEVDGYRSAFTWIRILNADRSLLVVEDWVVGHLDEDRVVRRAIAIVAAGSAHPAAAHLTGMSPEKSLSTHHFTFNGRAVTVRVEYNLSEDDEPTTWLTVTDDATGNVLADEEREGWLTEDLLTWIVRPIVCGAPTLATDDHEWVSVILGAGEVSSWDAEATESGLAEVAYSVADNGGIAALIVTAHLSEWQNEQIADLLYDHHREARRRGNRALVGEDRVCLHDNSTPVVHDQNCRLVAFDHLAGALQVEVQALLAEPQPDERGGNADRPHT